MERRRETDMCILRVYSNLRALVSLYARRQREYLQDLKYKDLTEQRKETCLYYVDFYKALHCKSVKEIEQMITFKCNTKQR
jgi:hypothetical protein